MENINEDQIPQPFVTTRLPVTNKREPTERIKTGQDHPNVNLLSSLNLMQMFMLKKELIDQLMNISEIQEIMTEVTEKCLECHPIYLLLTFCISVSCSVFLVSFLTDTVTHPNSPNNTGTLRTFYT